MRADLICCSVVFQLSINTSCLEVCIHLRQWLFLSMLSEKFPDQFNNRKNFGYVIIKLIYAKLQICEIFQNNQCQLPVEYYLNSVFSLLVIQLISVPVIKKERL